MSYKREIQNYSSKQDGEEGKAARCRDNQVKLKEDRKQLAIEEALKPQVDMRHQNRLKRSAVAIRKEEDREEEHTFKANALYQNALELAGKHLDAAKHYMETNTNSCTSAFDENHKELVNARKLVMELEKKEAKLKIGATTARRKERAFKKQWTPEKVVNCIKNPAAFRNELDPIYAKALDIETEHTAMQEKYQKQQEEEIRKANEERDKVIAYNRKLNDEAYRILQTGNIPPELKTAYNSSTLGLDVLIQFLRDRDRKGADLI